LKEQTNREIVELVYRNHSKWLLQVAYNFAQDKEASEDLVQELYVYLLEMKDIGKIRYNGTVNLFYLYKILKSKFLNNIKQNNKLNLLPVEEDYLEIKTEEYSLDKDEEFEKMLEHTKHLLESEVFWFDAKLLQVYINEKHSIASLHKATGISKSSIWTSLSKTRTFIKENYKTKSYAGKERSGSI
jgi:DNA-directed RNA polymerase specialized sigma24 family protein